jgi:RNA polymerase sigma-70 factor (ECF subfamily)
MVEAARRTGRGRTPVTIIVNKTRAPTEARVREALLLSVADNFETIFLEHWPHVYGVLVRLVDDHAEAEDLALETFWRLFQRADARELNLGGWLYRVATNLGLNAIRSWKRREQHERQTDDWETENAASADPAEVAAANEERARVRQILRKLNPRQAQLLLLRHSGLSYQEIAAALGVKVNSIGTLLARAEKEFEARWQEDI